MVRAVPVLEMGCRCARGPGIFWLGEDSQIATVEEIDPPQRTLMGPGPSDVDPRILAAMAKPVIGHLDPAFLTIMDQVQQMLKRIFRTRNELTIPVSATGSAGMECCLVNLLEPDDEAIVCVNGVFGSRMADIAERCGAKVIRVNAPWGEPIQLRDVEAALDAATAPKLLAIVHAETSTGVLQPLAEIGERTRAADALFVVDAVTSLGGLDVRVDDWGVDAVYSGTQKCLSASPGLSPVSFSDRAVVAMEQRRQPPQSWYLDMSMVRRYWGGERAYHHTAPISAIYGLHEALRLVFDEGLECRFERHRMHHEKLRDGLQELGFEYIVEEPFRLPMLNAVRLPAGLEDAVTRRRLLEEFQIEVGGGLGDFAGKIWRIGLMGASCTEENIDKLLNAMTTVIN